MRFVRVRVSQVSVSGASPIHFATVLLNTATVSTFGVAFETGESTLWVCDDDVGADDDDMVG